ncbi:conserved hypothetical protein [Leishmania braziliensis MHOM/BR/75/M2904]|uniref:Uncharacterized protein n=2 Tax=Leishmania braziliensis TaxID=5660 RepID=A4HIB6_LEIBR|nr:conserved hypothetical protein [Leishmania braziliensis MHOM/BR/75/M2904]KAI5689758.1 hypothetical protein MNV84_05926 [Leishmania braziliensis]CAJ2477213.1 unnamed protein product [Leishmania braziliensis]CAM40326.2 conserved hypothetical protein [Leishmania braziliensis MHOM/BR/75/M2904]SYZ67984.1 hypothetical_protein [Leishmania braziliensis MHOM/BR/75/M2904]
MFSAKYYDNPFADSDDDICYAEIMSDGDDGGTAADARPRFPSISPTAAFNSAWRGSSETAKSGCLASMEIPLSTVHGSRRGSTQADNLEYEAYIELLCAELMTANADNNRLAATQSKLESRVRKLSFEKENAERQMHQEKERNRVLADKVSALEEELKLMMVRASSAAHRHGAMSLETSSLHTSTSPERPSAAAPRMRRRDPNASQEQFIAPDTSFEQPRRLELSPSAAWRAPSADGSSSLRALEQIHHAQAVYATFRGGSYDRHGEPIMTTALPQRGRTGYEPRGEAPSPLGQQTRCSQRGAAAAYEITLAQQQARKEQAAAAQELEAHLREHSQQRDELMKQLERLERTRTRTVADRKKKAAVERDLEAEEKVIGQIRLELRSRSALLR